MSNVMQNNNNNNIHNFTLEHIKIFQIHTCQFIRNYNYIINNLN